uniref:Uncharacterized protein n=1 Tax=Glossina pallidipes TaxID=7398 RepID=A0A1A9ZNL6_GLOPL
MYVNVVLQQYYWVVDPTTAYALYDFLLSPDLKCSMLDKHLLFEVVAKGLNYSLLFLLSVNLDEAETVVVRIGCFLNHSSNYLILTNHMLLSVDSWIWKINGLSPKNYLKLSKDFEMKIL